MNTYIVEHYGADGCNGPDDDYIVERGVSSLAEARAVVRGCLGVKRLHPRRRWHGGDLCVEAYHDLPESAPNSYGCGGYAISIESE